MSNNGPIKKAWNSALIAGTIAGSATGQPDLPKQLADHQKTQMQNNSRQVNTGRANPTSSGKK